MAKKKSARPKKFFSPLLLSLAGAAGWAAMHSPPSLSSQGEVGAWLISALAVGLFIRAVLAIISPIIKLFSDILQHLSGPSAADDRNDAGL